MINFVTPTSCAPPPISTKENNRSFAYKQKSIQTWDKFYDPPPRHVSIAIPCGRPECMGLYMFAVIWIFCFRENTILLFERNKLIIKILLKDISKQ